MKSPTQQPPHALLVITTDCAHCPPVLDALSRMIKDGIIGHLEVINVALHSEKARALGATSAPWIRIGQFDLTGRYSKQELRNWADLATTNAGLGAYFTHLLENRSLDQIINMVKQHPDRLEDLMQLLEDLETPMAVRIGVGAAIEELQELQLLTPAIPKLIELTMSDQPQIRADACHYLGLTGNTDALPAVQSLLLDKDSEVREIAAETFAILEGNM
ncbi:MAG: HEAT repeat domain-containing protein [Gammaproteobacteria bacterium]|nr:HEAT repeat domain-containing protein [Gammaproteobacteria bacterium]